MKTKLKNNKSLIEDLDCNQLFLLERDLKEEFGYLFLDDDIFETVS